MAKKIKNEIGMNEPAIDEDSFEIIVEKNKTKILKISSIRKRNNNFFENIFFYSYPFPISYIKKPIISEKKNQKA